MKNEKTKKILRIVGDVLFGIFIVFILFIAITNVRAKANNGLPNMFGQGYLNVLTDSMDESSKDKNDPTRHKDSFKAGDLIFVKLVNKTQAGNLKEGQIITYHTLVNGTEMTISHRIIAVSEVNGQKVYTTQGDNPLSQFADTDSIRQEQVMAVYEGQWKGAGSVAAWFASGVGFFVVVVLPCILFLIFEIVSFVKTYIEYQNEKKGIAASGGPDSIANKIRIRKEAFAELVKDGTLTQEQADKKLNDYIDSLTAEETPAPKADAVEVEAKDVVATKAEVVEDNKEEK